MKPRKPGRTFWICTFIVGVFSPGTGKRRVNRKMQVLYRDARSQEIKNSELTSENKYLRRELQRVQGANNAFHVQDEMTDGLVRLAHADTENTMPLSVVN